CVADRVTRLVLGRRSVQPETITAIESRQTEYAVVLVTNVLVKADRFCNFQYGGSLGIGLVAIIEAADFDPDAVAEIINPVTGIAAYAQRIAGIRQVEYIQRCQGEGIIAAALKV